MFYRYAKYLRVEKPVVDVAMFYPAVAQRLRPDQGYAPLFAQASAYIRDFANFDILDDRMVQDGFLANYRVLVLWEGTQADQSTLDKIKAWVNDGGVVLAYDFGKVANLEGETPWYAANDLFGYIQELAPATITERYMGAVPAQYRLQVGNPEAEGYLGDGGEGWDPKVEVVDTITRRWAGSNATLHLPVNPEKQYTLVVRATAPPEATGLKRRVLLNGHELGELGSPGDVTYRFIVPTEDLENNPLATLTFQSQTFQQPPVPNATVQRIPRGVLVQSVQMIEQGSPEAADATAPPGVIRRELNIGLLNKSWARRFGKGLTIYYPANRKLLKGYFEVIRRAIYRLSTIDPDRRDALPIDDAQDGVYATLFPDKILYYNATDKPVTKTVKIPAEIVRCLER